LDHGISQQDKGGRVPFSYDETLHDWFHFVAQGCPQDYQSNATDNVKNNDKNNGNLSIDSNDVWWYWLALLALFVVLRSSACCGVRLTSTVWLD
jgi:hypothetical protein